MDGTLNADFPLPPLRADLRLIEGPEAEAGQRVWKIHDPLAQRYFEIGQEVVDLLADWHGATLGSLARRKARGGDVEEARRTIVAVLHFLEANELLAPRPQQSFARAKAGAKAQPSWLHKLLHGYLFFRVPLARPDRFLRRTLPFVAWAFLPAFWWTVLILAVLGLHLLSRQWEAFLGSFSGMLDLGGLATYGLCLVGVKVLHELGHGYTAVKLGSRVGTMGVAFMVMVPVAYTDTTDAWRLRSRADRVRIDIAGVAVEVLIAVLATLAWVFLPESGGWGALRSAAFALATTGWVMSLGVNLNPLMRFDGYYLLSDLVGEPNLQERSFALARWHLRELLFGYGDARPEELKPRSQFGLIAYAWAVWIYRFFLFLGIALLVYHFFFKALGVFLFAVEIWWFVLRPIWRELLVWVRRRREGGRRARWTLALALTLLALCFVPWPSMLHIPAVLSAGGQTPAYAPRAARVEQLLIRPGQQVQRGDLLLQLSAPALDDALARAQESALGLEERMARRAADARDLSESLVLAGQLRLEQDRIAGLLRERERLAVRAPASGTVLDIAPELHPGRWIDGKTLLVLIARPAELQARGFADGSELARIEEGRLGRFVDESRLMKPVDMRLQRIAAAASESIDEPLLTSAAGGALPVRPDGEKRHVLRPEYAAFEVLAAAVTAQPGPAAMTEIRGELQIRGNPQSLALRAFRRVAQILVRETVL